MARWFHAEHGTSFLNLKSADDRKKEKKSKPTSGIKILRWNGILYMDQKVCLNLVKKDQLCAVGLMKRK